MHHPKTVGRPDLTLPPDLIGTTAAVQRAADVVRQAAQSAESVLIVAEPGFSPERIARAIHEAGSRASDPFLKIDCADPRVAVVRQLFGSDRTPRADYETAIAGSALAEVGKGTIFLADVGEMPTAAQLRLSRLIRDGEMRVRRSTVPSRFRLIAAATLALEADVHQHRFRPELFRRLQQLRVDVPPLRDRPGDLPSVIEAVFDETCQRRNLRCALSPAARTALSALRWAGNLAELRASLERLIERCAGGLIRQEDVLADLQQLETRPRTSRTTLASLREARQTFERDYIASVLDAHGGRMTDAARVLGIERANLYRKTRQLGITRLKPRTS
jgi:DNA-binding NtrC family response regulator